MTVQEILEFKSSAKLQQALASNPCSMQNGRINKIKIKYNKTDQEPPYHKGIEPVCFTE